VGLTLAGGSSANGAVRAMTGSRVLIQRCVITGNSGPGVQAELDSLAQIDESTVSDNGGTGIALWKAGATITNSIITGNAGGGIMCSLCNPNIVRNIIAGNQAATGGGIHCTNSSVPVIQNNTIVGNQAQVGAGIYCADNAKAKVFNCIIAFNTPGPGVQCAPDGEAVVKWCDVYGNQGGGYVGLADPTGSNGNISDDPLFADLEGRDYHLKSVVGRFDPATNSWKQDQVTSPCIDAGNPSQDINEEPTPNGARVNMGRYGGTEEASKTATIHVRPHPRGVEPRRPLPH
jgi:hypothetical protein